MTSTANSAITAMRALRAEIESRLMKNEDYRAFLALEKAIAEVSPPVLQERANQPESELGRTMRRIGEEVLQKSPSQPEATARILSDYGPLPTADILSLIKEYGGEVGGNEPAINLSSSISKSGHFRSVRINGVPHWWFKDRELPEIRRAPAQPAMNFGGQTDATASAAENSNSTEGNDDAAA